MADRLALIIANSDFEDEKLCRLKTPIRDAEALAAVLDDPDIGDFDVTLLIDEPEPLVRRRIARLYHRRKRSDLLLLYYSGHGIRDAHGDLYLATRNTEIDLVGATALDAAYVRKQIDKSNSRRNVVVLDCCHSGAFAGGKSGLGDSVGTEDAFAGSGYGRVILTASDALELSWEGDEWLGEDRPSVFTNFLVEGLRTGKADLDGDGKITLDELYDYVYEQVMTSSYAKQTPHKILEVKGNIFIAHSPVVRPADLPQELLAAIESPLAGVREGAVDELDRLLQGCHPGLALAAREALQNLTDDDSRSVSAAARESLAAYEAAQRSEKDRSEVDAGPSAPPAREPERLTRREAASSLGQTLHSLITSAPAWGWIAGGAVLVLLAVALFSQGFGLWAEPRPTMIPTETLLATLTQEPTATATVESKSTSTLTPRATESSALLLTATPPVVDPTCSITYVIQTGDSIANIAFKFGVSMESIISYNGLEDNLPPHVGQILEIPVSCEHSIPVEPALGDTWTRPADEAVMVYVPAGEFEMGSTEGDNDEQPVHTVSLDGFWIDKHEVTNAQFAAFLNEKGNQEEGGTTWLELDSDYCLIEKSGEEFRSKSGYADHPVVAVSWYGAKAYADWVGGRLPSEAEWEYAARGKQGLIYPWGDEFDCSLGNFNDEIEWEKYVVPGGEDCDEYERTAPVGSFPDGASWCGALDMAGNVWEWTLSLYRDYPYDPDDGREDLEAGDSRVARGGSFSFPWTASAALPAAGTLRTLATGATASGWWCPHFAEQSEAYLCTLTLGPLTL